MTETFITSCPMEHRFLTPEDGAQYFFGYYDMRADDGSGRHLCHRVRFADRLPGAQDVAELGYLENRVFTPFAKTTAWNFQQGAMLEYHPREKNTVFYNTVHGGKFVTAMQNFATGETRYADRPSACHSPRPPMAESISRILRTGVPGCCSRFRFLRRSRDLPRTKSCSSTISPSRPTAIGFCSCCAIFRTGKARG